MRRLRITLLVALAWPGVSAAGAPASAAEIDELLRSGQALVQQGKLLDAHTRFASAYELSRGGDPAAEAAAAVWLSPVLLQLGRFTEAERTLLRCLELEHASRDPRPFAEAWILASLGSVDFELRRYSQADRRFLDALSVWRKVPEHSRHPDFAALLNNLAMLRYGQKRFSDAERYLREAVAVWRHSLPPTDLRVIQGDAHLAAILSRLGHHTEAGVLSSQAMTAIADRLEEAPLVGARVCLLRAAVLRGVRGGSQARELEATARRLFRQAGVGQTVDRSLLAAPGRIP
jgi:tetratricopeptide (TPR) repeat protein